MCNFISLYTNLQKKLGKVDFQENYLNTSCVQKLLLFMYETRIFFSFESLLNHIEFQLFRN